MPASASAARQASVAIASVVRPELDEYCVLPIPAIAARFIVAREALPNVILVQYARLARSANQ
jgi:hypothetical protein